MPTNTIRASLTLSFKGEAYNLDSVIDLNRHLGSSGEAPNFHLILAQAARIDPYSYLYEALETHEIEFTDATGVAAQYCHDGAFDWIQFAQEMSEERDWLHVRSIAAHTLPGRDLDADPALKAALLATYRAGKANGVA